VWELVERERLRGDSVENREGRLIEGRKFSK
jgi:hypothetical protein